MSRKKSTKGSLRSPSTGWDPLAAWYDGWVGKDGSIYHQKLAIPAALELLSLSDGEQVLDIGSGQGVLAPYIRDKGGIYTGVDASTRLVRTARKRHGKRGEFYEGDARALAGIPGLEGEKYDAAIFLLSLQDMDPLEDALESAAWALRPAGRLVVILTHPCFRIPRQSGWGWDENRRLRYRRIDRYLTPLPVPLKPYPGQQGGVSRSYHRPLQNYVNAMGQNGLAVTALREIPTFKKSTGPRAKAENRANEEVPLFLGILARKIFV